MPAENRKPSLRRRYARVPGSSLKASTLLGSLLLMALSGCAHHRVDDTSSMPWQSSRQLVLVTVADWNSDHGSLRRYARTDGGAWRQDGDPQTVVIGRSGAAWGIGLQGPRRDGPVKVEGDGRSPAGVFAIGEAFGYGNTARTALPYVPMTATDYCIDVSASPLYNRIVDANTVGEDAVAGSTEPMRRDLHADGDQRYKLGFVIDHNRADADTQATPAAGSCIFAHVWKSPTTPTAGCTAMPEPVMEQTLAWLDPAMHPIFVLLPDAEYARLQATWQLPAGVPTTTASSTPTNDKASP